MKKAAMLFFVSWLFNISFFSQKIEPKIAAIYLLGSGVRMGWKQSEKGLIIRLPECLPEQPAIGFRIEFK